MQPLFGFSQLNLQAKYIKHGGQPYLRINVKLKSCGGVTGVTEEKKEEIQPVSYKRYFRCNSCFLLLVYTINPSLSTDLVDPPPMRTFYMKSAVLYTPLFYCMG